MMKVRRTLTLLYVPNDHIALFFCFQQLLTLSLLVCRAEAVACGPKWIQSKSGSHCPEDPWAGLILTSAKWNYTSNVQYLAAEQPDVKPL